jgi:hypothetical protein
MNGIKSPIKIHEGMNAGKFQIIEYDICMDEMRRMIGCRRNKVGDRVGNPSPKGFA